MLPPEIIDYIFSFLQLDCPTLEECARAHPILSKLVQRHLYATIAINNDPAEVLRFSKLVSDNPCIASYVRNLRIEIIESEESLESHCIGPLYEEDIALILPKFQELRRITFCLCDRSPTKWPMLHERFRAAFLQCLRLPSVIEVSIHGDNDFPLTAFANCTSIKKLTLDGTCTFDDSFDEPYPQVESLIQIWRYSLPAIASWAKKCSLRSLGLCLPPPNDSAALAPLLQVCSNTLTSLELDFDITYQTIYVLLDKTSYPPSPIPFSLSCLTKIEDLTIYASMSFIGRGSHYFSSLPAMATLVTSAPSLKRLTVEVHVECNRTPYHEAHLEVDWSPLALLPYSIESIELYLSTTKRSGFPPDECLSFLEGNTELLKMVKQRALKVERREISIL